MYSINICWLNELLLIITISLKVSIPTLQMRKWRLMELYRHWEAELGFMFTLHDPRGAALMIRAHHLLTY